MGRLINIGIDINLKGYFNEINYVLSNFMYISGFSFRIIAIDLNKWGFYSKEKLALYYGLSIEKVEASIKVLYSGNNYLTANLAKPKDYCEEKGTPFIKFIETERCIQDSEGGKVVFLNDIIFSSFWMLTGHLENTYNQDRFGNFHLEDTFYLKNGLNLKPIVSIYANMIKKYWSGNKSVLGVEEPLPLPYIGPSNKAVIALSHDVDYPEMIKWIECLRIIGKRRLSGFKYLLPIIKGNCNFWKFLEWIEFEKSISAKSAFYFMGRQGSLLEYFLGKPDAFYDIKTKKFSELFSLLKDKGAEIGMHASFNAYKSVDIFLNEKNNIEQTSKTTVYGNRHHYWHLKPRDNQDTLRIHEKAGLLYDSSLFFEFYPGFRRGICHPFYPYDISKRREIKVLQLPTAWMDNQFYSHIKQNRTHDPMNYAKNIMNTVLENNGTLILDYHVRGMNEVFYPQYGAWLKRLFLEERGIEDFNFFAPLEIAQSWIRYISQINQVKGCE